MISLNVMMWIFIILFAIVGAIRGWAKEILVTFSVILALFIMVVLENYIPFFKSIIKESSPTTVFWVRSIILIIMVIVGYQTPRMGKLAEIGHWLRNMLSDSLLGIIFGAINGYLLFGTVWYYIAAAHYPFAFVIAPDPSTAIGQKAMEWISMLPPAWLMQTPLIYIAVAVCFIFVLVAVI